MTKRIIAAIQTNEDLGGVRHLEFPHFQLESLACCYTGEYVYKSDLLSQNWDIRLNLNHTNAAQTLALEIGVSSRD